MPLPNRTFLKGIDSQVVESYFAHVHLRLLLDSIDRTLHEPTESSQDITLTQAFDSLSHFGVNFATDRAPQNIHAARLFTKYWGAKALIYRPYVQHILHSDETSQIEAHFVEFAPKAIAALINSIRAFHSLDQRQLIVDNPYGTSVA